MLSFYMKFGGFGLNLIGSTPDMIFGPQTVDFQMTESLFDYDC